MVILLVQIPASIVSIDQSQYQDRDDSHILEHLVRYCGLFDVLPVITVVIEGDEVKIVRGHKYLLAARMLGRELIRAVVASAPSHDDVKRFLARPDVTILDWEAIRAREELDPKPKGWHLYYFERPLSEEEKRAFDAEVVALFSDPDIRVLHDDSGPAALFDAYTPVTDPAWAAENLRVFTRLSQQYVPIVSYQGRRFAGAL